MAAANCGAVRFALVESKPSMETAAPIATSGNETRGYNTLNQMTSLNAITYIYPMAGLTAVKFTRTR